MTASFSNSFNRKNFLSKLLVNVAIVTASFIFIFFNLNLKLNSGNFICTLNYLPETLTLLSVVQFIKITKN